MYSTVRLEHSLFWRSDGLKLILATLKYIMTNAKLCWPEVRRRNSFLTLVPQNRLEVSYCENNVSVDNNKANSEVSL